jgi:hypothetical protein
MREAGGGIEIESTTGGEGIRCLAVVVATGRIPAVGFLAGENMAGARKRHVREESDYFRAQFGPALLDRIR